LLTLFAAEPSYSYSWYSGASVGSDGTVYGWGVTDGTPTTNMYHVAYVTTTLTSPVKRRQATLGQASAHNMVREDVSLPFDEGDLGVYTVTSLNDAYCYGCLCYFIPIGTRSSASTTLPWVVMSLRTGMPAMVSPDDSAGDAYYLAVHTKYLGTFLAVDPVGNHLWSTGVEIMGKVYPSSFTGITFKRQLMTRRVYKGSVEVTSRRIDPANNYNDTDTTFQDTDPQSGGSRGVVYDVDAPGIGSDSSDAPGMITRKRDNFREWAYFNGQVVSLPFDWFSRLSVVKPSTGYDQLSNGISGDNTADTGTTKITWNLQ